MLECTGSLPDGTYGHGYYNLNSGSPIHGHIKADNCHSIYLVDRLFHGRRTCSVQFFNNWGEPMFKIFVGRDASRELIAEQVSHFDVFCCDCKSRRTRLNALLIEEAKMAHAEHRRDRTENSRSIPRFNFADRSLSDAIPAVIAALAGLLIPTLALFVAAGGAWRRLPSENVVRLYEPHRIADKQIF